MYVCAKGRLHGSFCLQLGGGSAPPPTTPLFKGHRWLQRKRASVRIHAGAIKEGCADHFVCNWGGLRPPPTPPLFKGHRGCKNRTSVRICVCAKERLRGWFCLQLGRLRPPQPPRFLKAIDGCKEKEQASAFILALKEGCADHFVCKWGRLRPPQPPRFLKAIDGCTKRTSVRIYVCAKGSLKAIDGCEEKEQASGCMLALKEGCAGHFVCNWGGPAPPPNLRPFQRPSTPAKKEQASGCRRHPCLR